MQCIHSLGKQQEAADPLEGKLSSFHWYACLHLLHKEHEAVSALSYLDDYQLSI